MTDNLTNYEEFEEHMRTADYHLEEAESLIPEIPQRRGNGSRLIDGLKELAGTVFVFSPVIFLGSVTAVNEHQRENLYQRTFTAIEYLDGKIITTDDDWAIAYQEALGRNFNARTPNPAGLHIKDLQLILDCYSLNSSSEVILLNVGDQ